MEKEVGVVKLKVYLKYCRAVGSLLSPVILLSLIAMQVEILFESTLNNGYPISRLQQISGRIYVAE